MLFKEVVQLVLAAIVLWSRSTEAAPMASVKLCGRHLSEIMSRVCHAYNSPSWDVPTVVEQTGVVARRKRQLGIADECCVIGCTWEQLSEYCSISAYSESPLENMEMEHIIEDRSVEVKAEPVVPASVGDARHREVGRTRGYGRARRCRCRRRRDRRLMGPRKKCARCSRGRHSVPAHNVGKDSEY